METPEYIQGWGLMDSVNSIAPRVRVRPTEESNEDQLTEESIPPVGIGVVNDLDGDTGRKLAHCEPARVYRQHGGSDACGGDLGNIDRETGLNETLQTAINDVPSRHIRERTVPQPVTNRDIRK